MYRSKDNLLNNDKGSGTEPPDLTVGTHYGSTNNAPPPASRFWFGNDESVLERLRQAREHYHERDSHALASSLVNYCLGTIVFAIIVLATFLVPAAAVITGSLFANKCPHQPMVPIILIVGGLLTLLSGVSNLVVRSGRFYPTDSDVDGNGRKYIILGTVTGILNLVIFAIFVLGCFYVYSSLWPSSDPESPNYCSPTAFYFAFWLHTAVFIFIGVLFLVGVSGMIFGSFCNC